MMDGDSPLDTTALLRLENFGRTSLADLLLAVEKFLTECTLDVDDPQQDPGGKLHSERPTPLVGNARSGEGLEDLSATHRELHSAVRTMRHLGVPSQRWALATEELRSLLATSAEVLGTGTLADALRPDVARLARRMRLDASLHSVPLHEAMLGKLGLPAIVTRRLRATLEDLTDAQRVIVETRLVEPKTATLEEVGRQVGVTRERIRQIQNKLERKIRAALGEELSVIASTLREQCDPFVSAEELDQRIGDVMSDSSATVASVFRSALIREMGLTLDGDAYISELATRVIRSNASRARELADDAGLVREQDLIASLPDGGWRRFWPSILRRTKLHSIHGSLALRDSAKARAKAALLSLGRPATREEIGSVCGQPPTRVGANLSNIPSVVRADPERWGIREWIDDEYDGIVGEIIQRIEEDGGATTVERLLREIPSKFNVSPVSVDLYMRTPRFEIRNGSISLANPGSVRLRDLDDVIHGRDEHGAPFWTFVVEDRYFQGYSVLGVPSEFARALGCEPDSSAKILVENLPDCRPLSVHWRLASTTGASLGYVAAPLSLLELQPGDRARVTIGKGQSVRLSPDESVEPSLPSQKADATLARILNRRRGI